MLIILLLYFPYLTTGLWLLAGIGFFLHIAAACCWLVMETEQFQQLKCVTLMYNDRTWLTSVCHFMGCFALLMFYIQNKYRMSRALQVRSKKLFSIVMYQWTNVSYQTWILSKNYSCVLCRQTELLKFSSGFWTVEWTAYHALQFSWVTPAVVILQYCCRCLLPLLLVAVTYSWAAVHCTTWWFDFPNPNYLCLSRVQPT